MAHLIGADACVARSDLMEKRPLRRRLSLIVARLKIAVSALDAAVRIHKLVIRGYPA